MKVLLVGHAGCYNRGCEAIIRATILMLKKEFSDLEIVLTSNDLEEDCKIDFGYPVKIINGRSTDLWKKGTFAWYFAKILRRLPDNRELDLLFYPIRKYLDTADVVISIGGDNYTQDYKNNSLKMFLSLNKYIKRYKKKLVIWGASIGPFEENCNLSEITKGLNLADLITVRESKSFDYLQKIGVHNIKKVADPAFLLQTKNVEIPVEINNRTSKLLGFNISPLLRSYLTPTSIDIFRRESIQFLRQTIVEKGFQVVLIPHVVQQDGGLSDDYAYMDMLYQALKKTGKVVLLSTKYSSEEIKHVISLCDFFIGARTHSTIAALSSGVPTISIGYSQKSVGINEDVLGTLDYLLPIKDYSAETLTKKLDILIQNHDSIRLHITKVMPHVKEMSWQNVNYLKELLNK